MSDFDSKNFSSEQSCCLYGQVDSEKRAKENALCRQIVKEISDFGITDRQRLFIIYLLALELERHDHMHEVVCAVKNIENSQIFISSDDQEGVG